MTKQTVESRAAKTVLQAPKDVTIGNKTYRVAPPSTATLIMVSESVSSLPAIKVSSEDMIVETLAYARDCRAMGDTIAILVLGAKKCRSIMPWWRYTRKRLAQRILEDMEPKDMNALLINLLTGAQVAFFFGILTSLSEANLLRVTRNETTASGQ